MKRTYFVKPKSFDQSFASHDRAKNWHPTKNGNVKPKDVCRKSNKVFWFTCDECTHDFSISLDKVSDNRWCPYCCIPSRRFCEDETCEKCFNRSFASHYRSQWWSEDNALQPKQVFLGCAKVFLFICNECDHKFEISPNSITNLGSWCPFCCSPPQRLCDDQDCVKCFEKSFASHPKALYWCDETFNPRKVFKTTHSKKRFKCERGHVFRMRLSHISFKGCWCPRCRINKAEEQLSKLCENSPYIIKLEKKSIRCIDSHNKNTTRNLIPDLMVTLSNNTIIMIEMDGEQHFNPNHLLLTHFNTEFRDQVCRDLCKNRYARDNNMSLLRISYLEYDNIEYWVNSMISEVMEKNAPVMKCSNPKLYNDLREYCKTNSII